MYQTLTNIVCLLTLSAILLGCKKSDDDLTNDVGMKLTKISAGEFMMGHDPLTFGSPVHEVKMDEPFYLGVHEVTQQQYEDVMGSNPSRYSAAGTSEHPVERVSWVDAIEFCNKLSEKEGLTPYYKIAGDEVTIVGGSGYRLPTEAEWEYACRAGTTTLWSFGDDEQEVSKHAWVDTPATHPVGQLAANPNGLYDMHGNVWEWCYDWAEPYDGQQPTVEPAGSKRRILRGGSFFNGSHLAESGFRGSENPTHRSEEAGFRVAKDSD